MKLLRVEFGTPEAATWFANWSTIDIWASNTSVDKIAEAMWSTEWNPVDPLAPISVRLEIYGE